MTKLWYLGVALGCSQDHLSWKNHKGSGKEEILYQLLYTGLKNKYFYLHASALASEIWSSAHRNINIDASFLSETRKAKHNTWGFSIDSRIEIGAVIEKGVQLRPYGCLDYIFLKQNFFSETGASSIDLDVKDYQNTCLRSEGGVELTYISKGESYWAPHVKFACAYEKRYQGDTIEASLKNQECVFATQGNNPDYFLLVPGAGIAVKLCKQKVTLYLDYTGQIGKSYQSSNWTGQLGVRF